MTLDRNAERVFVPRDQEALYELAVALGRPELCRLYRCSE